MAIKIALEKFRGEPATIAHLSGDHHRLDSNAEWHGVKSRVFNALSRLGVEDIRIVIHGKKAGEVTTKVRRLVETLERPDPSVIQKS